MNVAVTDLAADIVTLQAPVPLQAPLHPPKRDVPSGVASGLAVGATPVPASKLAGQVAAEQLTPAGELVMVPPPVPASVTVNAKVLVSAGPIFATNASKALRNVVWKAPAVVGESVED